MYALCLRLVKGRKAEFRGNINHVYYFALFSGDYPLLCKREGQKEIDSRAAVDISRVNSLPRLHTPPISLKKSNQRLRFLYLLY